MRIAAATTLLGLVLCSVMLAGEGGTLTPSPER
jgi:hypothetical protein